MNKFQPGDRVIIARVRSLIWENAAGTVVRYTEQNSTSRQKLVDIEMDRDGAIHSFFEYRLELEDDHTPIAVSEATLFEILNSI